MPASMKRSDDLKLQLGSKAESQLRVEGGRPAFGVAHADSGHSHFMHSVGSDRNKG